MQNKTPESTGDSFKAMKDLRQKLGLLGHYTFLLKQRMVDLRLTAGRLDTITENEAKELLERRTGRTTELLLEALCRAQIPHHYNVIITTANSSARRTVMEKLCEFTNKLNAESATPLWSTRNENQVRNEATGCMIAVVVVTDIDDYKRSLSPAIVLPDV